MREWDREDLLRESQPFICHVAAQVCGRYLEWGRDEELSEALIAFNEALEHFESGKGVPFLAYARLLIKRRLIDYFRRRERSKVLPLEQPEVEQAVDFQFGMEQFREREQNEERAMEILEFAKELTKWDLKFADLVEVSPKHRDTRASLLQAAAQLAGDTTMWKQVEEKGKIPIQSLAAQTGLHIKVLERGRKYLLAVAILMARKHDYIYLREYVLPPERGLAR
ncbi:MAG: RNA polymerase sigma-I factor [Desulfitobacteriaceae bacterium]